jgi:hypothetical protein
MSLSNGSKVSYLLTFQLSSPNLTYQMMESIGLSVDEIVITRDAALMYVYIHLQRKVRGEELAGGMEALSASHGVKGSNIYGYDAITGSTPSVSEPIDDNPGFKMLVRHETTRNENFHHWAASGYSGHNCGYNLLKARLLAKRSSSGSIEEGDGVGWRTSGPAAGGGDGGCSGAANDEEPLPRPGSDGEQHKRRRTVSPGGRGHNFEYCDYVLSKVEKEQQRRESVEKELKEMQMKQKLLEQRQALGEEWAVKRKDEWTEIQRLTVSIDIDYFLYECDLKCLDRPRSRPRTKPTLMHCRQSLL